MARLKYYAVLALKCLLALASITQAAEGIRVYSSAAATKLSRLPGFGWVDNVEELDRVDAAFIGAIVLTVFLFMGWTELFGNVLMPDDQEEVGNSRRGHLIGTVLWCVGLAGMDGFLFYNGVVQSQWGESGFSWPGVGMALGFEFLVAIVAFASVVMKNRLEN